jgi:23S rRNA (cytosine1962-C5)-methyltransferase
LANFAGMNEIPILYLKPDKERSLLRFHPWVFSGAIDSVKGDLTDGAVVQVATYSGKVIATGHYQKGSITVRILFFGACDIDQEFWNQTLTSCFHVRERIGFPSPETNIFRLVHGEGDNLPGLIVDVYGSTAVVQCHSHGMFAARELIAEALVSQSNGIISNVFDKSAESLGLSTPNGFLRGSLSSEPVFENNHRFEIDFITGQKTGFFIDQRDNRQLLGNYSSGKSVLNTFCYTGGFSVYALSKGATHVDSVDSSKKAIALTDANIELNKFPVSRHQGMVADVPEWLKSNKGIYDLIVLDPPAFAKHQDARHRAVQAYKRLNQAAIGQIAPNGILFTFSCSQVVDRVLFRGAVTAAAIEAGREVVILHQLTQPADHPVNIYHPEGEYLKGLVLLVK